MVRAGMMELLGLPGQSFTLLAPSDEAFTKIQPSRLSKILEDKLALRGEVIKRIIFWFILQSQLIAFDESNKNKIS